MKHPLWDSLPRWLLTWLVSFALDLGLGVLLRADGRWWLAALVLLLWCALLAVAEHFGRFWAVIALMLVAFGLCFLLVDRGLLADSALAVFSRAGDAGWYGELVLLLVCAAAALPLSALLRFYRMRAALSLCWIAFWIASALLEWQIPRLIPAALIPLLLFTLAETICRFRREPEQGKPLTRALLLMLLPAAVLLAVLPVRAEPYGYPLLHSVADKAEQIWHDAETALNYRHKGDEAFGLSFNGVSDEADVGKDTEEGGRSIIYAKPDQTPGGAVYLFGNSWNHFDGRGWSSTLRSSYIGSLNQSMDTAEHVYALWRLLGSANAAEFSDYLRANSIYLSYRNMNVRTMFSVMNATRFFTDTDRFPYADAPTGTLFDYVQKDDVWYRVYFLDSNARTRARLIASAEGYDYDETAHGPRWYQILEDFPIGLHIDQRDDVNLEKAFAVRTELIYEVYLDSGTVSDRAAALATEITADCGSDYEKVNAIAAYLRDNYSYTLRPEPAPKDADFLDWLLFEGKEGYCTWYATAAVLLSRSVGVPARYVQGYRGVLPAGIYTTLDSGAAHAWCECYISGYGWVTVEATPGFESEGTGWLTAAELADANENESAIPPEEEEPIHGSIGRSDEELPTLPSPAGPGGKTEEPEPDSDSGSSGWLPILIAAVLLAALAAVWFWLRARRRRRYAEADPAARLTLDLKTLLRDLRGKGYPRQPEESLRQYFERLPWHYLLASKSEAMEMADLYDRTFFSREAPSEKEVERHRAFAATFRPQTLRQWLIWFRLQ